MLEGMGRETQIKEYSAELDCIASALRAYEGKHGRKSVEEDLDEAKLEHFLKDIRQC